MEINHMYMYAQQGIQMNVIYMPQWRLGIDCADLQRFLQQIWFPDSKVHGATMGPTWVLSTPYEPHVGPMNLAIKVAVV